jgi:cytochrome c peroxidase
MFHQLRWRFPPTMLAYLAVLTLTSTLAAQTDGPLPIPDDTLPAELPLNEIPLGLSSDRLLPADNELSAKRVQLGRRLFFDPSLSSDGTVSCATCHLPDRAFASSDPVAIGVGKAVGRRNTPTIVNRAYGKFFFWDGRSPSLEDQALQPIENPLEMANKLSVVLDTLRADANYREQFAAAYPGGVTTDNLARALASFQRVILSGDSAADRFQAGDFSALSDEARQGMWIFESRGQCWRCHSGPNYTDESFHNTGVSWGKKPLDLGRFEVTENEADRGRFHTPTLRNIRLTAPYMHDGSIATLDEVVEFYNKGGVANPHLDSVVKPLNLSDRDKKALVAFLKALTGSKQAATPEDESPKK